MREIALLLPTDLTLLIDGLPVKSNHHSQSEKHEIIKTQNFGQRQNFNGQGENQKIGYWKDLKSEAWEGFQAPVGLALRYCCSAITLVEDLLDFQLLQRKFRTETVSELPGL